MIPQQIINYLRANNSGHIIQAVMGENSIMVDGKIVPLNVLIVSGQGGTGTWTKDQIEGYFWLSTAQQTAMNVSINSSISGYLAGSPTNLATLSLEASTGWFSVDQSGLMASEGSVTTTPTFGPATTPTLINQVNLNNPNQTVSMNSQITQVNAQTQAILAAYTTAQLASAATLLQLPV